MNRIMLCLLFIFSLSSAQNEEKAPQEFTYISRDTLDLKLYVFDANTTNNSPAIIIFHGGGWALGEASWGFGLAKKFAQLGMVGIAVQYHLSDQKTITPLDAMSDAREAIRWVRKNASLLKIDPDKIAAYGWSAGGHLAAGAAIFNSKESNDTVNCSPNALILESAAVSLLADSWARKLLLGKADIRDISPDEHVRKGLPPALLLQGDLDTVTPLAGAERFQRKMIEHGNRCELIVYRGYGHLFTPGHLPDNGWPKPDPVISEKAFKESVKFLSSLNYID